MKHERIRLAIAGCGGGRGSWFTSQAARDPAYSVTALVDALPGAARVVAREYGLEGAALYASVEEAIAGPAWDALLVATPDGEHAPAVLAALRAGRWVYVEKPLALSLRDCLAIEEADRAAGRRTMVGMNLRHAPLYRRVRELRRSGALGRILTIQADEHYHGGSTYFRRWNRLRATGGGLWITKACHDFDVIGWLADDEPVAVCAQAALTHYVSRPDAGMRCTACPVEPGCPDSAARGPAGQPDWWREILDLRDASGRWPPRDLCLFNSDKDTFDHGSAQVRFASGALATYTLNVVAPYTERTLTLAGTEGTVRGSLSDRQLRYWRRAGSPANPQLIDLWPEGAPDSAHGGADAALLPSFARFVRGDRSGVVGPAEASAAVAMGLAATRSSETSAVVLLQDLDGWGPLRASLPWGRTPAGP